MARVARERRRKKDEKQVTNQQPLDAEARRMRLKTLIVLGKERGYLTYAETITCPTICSMPSRSRTSSA